MYYVIDMCYIPYCMYYDHLSISYEHVYVVINSYICTMSLICVIYHTACIMITCQLVMNMCMWLLIVIYVLCH